MDQGNMMGMKDPDNSDEEDEDNANSLDNPEMSARDKMRILQEQLEKQEPERAPEGFNFS